jgi:hypothetical protein
MVPTDAHVSESSAGLPMQGASGSLLEGWRLTAVKAFDC